MSGPEAALAGLDPEQREVATTLHGPVCVLAGAGTGKTRAVTRRIAYGVRTGTYDPTQVLAVSFTTRAAAEMRARLTRLGVGGVSTRTFHSAALAQVRHLWPRLYGTPFPSVLDDPAAVLTGLVDRAGLATSARDVAAEVAWAKVSNVGPDGYAEAAHAEGRRVAGASASQVADLYAGYVEALQQADRVDLEDVLLAAVGVLSSQPEAARLVRRRFRWFVVDEFQDVSGLQMALLRCWLGDRDDVCVVGDPAQAIYGFAGARADYLERFGHHMPGARLLRLTRSYRSTPQILAAAGALSASAGPPLVPSRPAGAPVVLAEAGDDGLAHVVARVQHHLATSADPSDVAVLVRTRADVVAVSRALRRAGVPVAAAGDARFFERPEVRGVLALLGGAVRQQGPVAATERALAEVGASGRGEDAAAVLLRLARSLERSAADAGEDPPTVADLLDLLRELARSGEEPAGIGVTVATLHATKGQEWATVLVAGAHEGSLPHPSASGRGSPAGALEEERRLLYVGMTRARDHLEVSWSGPRGTGRRRPPSRFLRPLLDGACDAVEIRLLPGPPPG